MFLLIKWYDSAPIFNLEEKIDYSLYKTCVWLNLLLACSVVRKIHYKYFLSHEYELMIMNDLWYIDISYVNMIWIYDYQSDWANKDKLIFIFSSSKQIARYSGAIAML
jgi:hypothetical protein